MQRTYPRARLTKVAGYWHAHILSTPGQEPTPANYYEAATTTSRTLTACAATYEIAALRAFGPTYTDQPHQAEEPETELPC